MAEPTLAPEPLARPDCEVLETLLVKDLVRSWRQDFGLEVSDLFSGLETLRLCRNLESGLVFFDPPVPGPEAFYQGLRRFPWYHPPAKAEHRVAASYLKPGDRILDIGAGEGGFSAFVQDGTYRGLEFDGEAVARGRELGRNLSQMSLEDASAAAPAAYDVVTAFQLLEHLPDPESFAVQAAALVAPGGWLILGVPSAESYLSALPDFVLNAPPHHLTWWTAQSLGDLLRRQGLQDLDFHEFPVEPWERRLWWMARVAKAQGQAPDRHFGAVLRQRKILSWLASGLLQWLKPPAQTSGATLLVAARKA